MLTNGFLPVGFILFTSYPVSFPEPSPNVPDHDIWRLHCAPHFSRCLSYPAMWMSVSPSSVNNTHWQYSGFHLHLLSQKLLKDAQFPVMEKYTQSCYEGKQFPGNCQLLGPLRHFLRPASWLYSQDQGDSPGSEGQGMYAGMCSSTFDGHCSDDACSHLVVPCHQCHRPEHTRNQASWMVANRTLHGEVAFPTFGPKCLLGGMLYIKYILMVNVLELWKTRTSDTFYTGRCSGCPKHCSQGHNPHSCPGSQRRFQHLGQSPRTLELLRPGKQRQGKGLSEPCCPFFCIETLSPWGKKKTRVTYRIRNLRKSKDSQGGSPGSAAPSGVQGVLWVIIHAGTAAVRITYALGWQGWERDISTVTLTP